MTTTTHTVEIGTSKSGKLTATTPGGLYVAAVDTLDALPSLAASVRRCREVWDGERDSLTQVRAWLDLADHHPLGALALRIAASEWGATADDPERDRVTTIALGDRRGDGSRIPGARFERIAERVAAEAEARGGTVYAVTYGDGVGSDGENDGEAERSAVILVGNVDDVAGLRERVAAMLRASGMTSAAFATDGEHEPVFDTPTGERRGDVEVTFPARRADGRPVVMDHAQGVASYVAATLGHLGAVEVTSRVTGDRGTVIRGKASRAEMIAGLDHLAVVLGTQGRIIGVDGSTVRVEGVADYVETRW